MTNYNDGNWHGWNGGECPVHTKSRVDIAGSWGITRNVSAYKIAWHNCIIAFRVVKEHREPREWWVFDRELHDSREGAKNEFDKYGSPYDEIIHVREVLE